jgi:hypothetical protein
LYWVVLIPTSAIVAAISVVDLGTRCGHCRRRRRRRHLQAHCCRLHVLHITVKLKLKSMNFTF